MGHKTKFKRHKCEKGGEEGFDGWEGRRREWGVSNQNILQAHMKSSKTLGELYPF